MASDVPRSLSGDASADAEPTPTYALLNFLLDERARLVLDARHLHARYGPQGTFAEQREIVRAQLALEYRERLGGGEGRLTQAMIDEAVRADDRYVAVVQEAEDARAFLYVMYDRIRQVNARIAFIFGPRVASPDQTTLVGPADAGGQSGEPVV